MSSISSDCSVREERAIRSLHWMEAKCFPGECLVSEEDSPLLTTKQTSKKPQERLESLDYLFLTTTKIILRSRLLEIGVLAQFEFSRVAKTLAAVFGFESAELIILSPFRAPVAARVKPVAASPNCSLREHALCYFDQNGLVYLRKLDFPREDRRTATPRPTNLVSTRKKKESHRRYCYCCCYSASNC